VTLDETSNKHPKRPVIHLEHFGISEYMNSISDAISAVRDGYPYPEILDETEDAIIALATAISKTSKPGNSLLDIGCGAMDKTLVYQAMGYECFAYDDFGDPWHRDDANISPLLAYASESGVQIHREVEHFEVPWPLESFDIVTIVNVIEHVHESPRDILNFAGRYLKPEGVLLVGMPNSVNLRKRIAVARGQSNYTPARGFYENVGEWRGHVREYTPQETSELLVWNGFKVIYDTTYNGILKSRLKNPLLRLIFRGLSTVFPEFRDSIIVVGQKPIDWTPSVPDTSEMDRSLTSEWIAKSTG